jgi:hypothetical protein
MTKQTGDKGEKQVLFLDFDGVLNNVAYLYLDKKDTGDYFADNLDPYNIRILNFILDACPNLSIIISSSWGGYYSLDALKVGLKSAGVRDKFIKRIEDITPRKFSSLRCHEVSWSVRDLEEEGYTVSKWKTLDDYDIFPLHGHFSDLKDREIKTDSRVGLTMIEAEEIIKYFEPGYKIPRIMI